MSPARAPMRPPDLAGYDHVRLLGSGGYSDVFLYEQRMPRRQVAIKVLVESAMGESSRAEFHAEANAMAAVSTHPYIVTVLHADVAASGHPFLVMEYYPNQNFSVRARNERIPVAEVLRVGVQVASAVETAHRAGILHRDIKPANILTSEYNRPGLTDFGIATSSHDDNEAEGMSIPWSPPEVVNGEASSGVGADVYSLAATVYTLLAGRSPFEEVGGSNRSFDLIRRIDRGNPPPTGRDDVPESLERLLRHGMSRSPLDRPGSAVELARMLQSVEIELGATPTMLEVRDESGGARGWEEPSEDGTRLKGPAVIHSQRSPSSHDTGLVTGAPSAGVEAPPDPGTVRRDAASIGGAPGLISGVGERPLGLSGVAPPRPVREMPSEHVGTPSVGSSPVGAAPPDAVAPAGHRRRVTPTAVAVGVVALVAALVVLRLVVASGTQDDPTATATEEIGPDRAPSVAAAPPAPTDVVLGPEGTEVSWSHGDESVEDHEYRVLGQDDLPLEIEGEPSGWVTGVSTARLSAEVADDECVTVVARPVDGGPQSSESEVGGAACR